MSAFAAALDSIFEDPNMAVDALWFPGGIGPGQPVRALRRAEDQEVEFGGSRLHSESIRIDVRVSQAPGAAKGDQIQIGDEMFVVQAPPRRDRERLAVMLDLRPVT